MGPPVVPTACTRLAAPTLCAIMVSAEGVSREERDHEASSVYGAAAHRGDPGAGRSPCGLSRQSYRRGCDRLACHDPPRLARPGRGPPQVSSFELFYALHDAMVRPLPGAKMGHSLAESWTESPDGLVYEFKLREGLRFHNGDPCTA